MFILWLKWIQLVLAICFLKMQTIFFLFTFIMCRYTSGPFLICWILWPNWFQTPTYQNKQREKICWSWKKLLKTFYNIQISQKFFNTLAVTGVTANVVKNFWDIWMLCWRAKHLSMFFILAGLMSTIIKNH